MKKALYPVALIGVVFAVGACSGARDATTQPASTDDEASLVLSDASAGSAADSVANEKASDAGSQPLRSGHAPGTTQIESELAEIDGDLTELDTELNEGSSEFGRTEAIPGE